MSKNEMIKELMISISNIVGKFEEENNINTNYDLEVHTSDEGKASFSFDFNEEWFTKND